MDARLLFVCNVCLLGWIQELEGCIRPIDIDGFQPLRHPKVPPHDFENECSYGIYGDGHNSSKDENVDNINENGENGDPKNPTNVKHVYKGSYSTTMQYTLKKTQNFIDKVRPFASFFKANIVHHSMLRYIYIKNYYCQSLWS